MPTGQYSTSLLSTIVSSPVLLGGTILTASLGFVALYKGVVAVHKAGSRLPGKHGVGKHSSPVRSFVRVPSNQKVPWLGQSSVPGWTATPPPPPTGLSGTPPSPVQGGGQPTTGAGTSPTEAPVFPTATPWGPPVPTPGVPPLNQYVRNLYPGKIQVNVVATGAPGIVIQTANGQIYVLNTNQTSAFLSPGDSIKFTLNPPSGWQWYQA